MPDPTPPPAPDPKKRTRGILNKAQQAALSKAEQIVLTAKKAAHAAKLDAREISESFVSDLDTDVSNARNKAALAVRDTTSTRSSTADEAKAEQNLMKALHEVQAAARQKYARSEPAKLLDYLIGTRLDANRAALEQGSQTIYEKLGLDTLPGITTAKKTALGVLRGVYMSTDSDQDTHQSDATTDRSQLKDMIDSITTRRLQIQFAADAEYPCTDDNCHGARKEFYLPLSRPFNG